MKLCTREGFENDMVNDSCIFKFIKYCMYTHQRDTYPCRNWVQQSLQKNREPVTNSSIIILICTCNFTYEQYLQLHYKTRSLLMHKRKTFGDWVHKFQFVSYKIHIFSLPLLSKRWHVRQMIFPNSWDVKTWV